MDFPGKIGSGRNSTHFYPICEAHRISYQERLIAMGSLDMKPEVVASHFRDLAAMADVPVQSSESDTTMDLRVKQSYRFPGDLIVMVTYDTPSQCTKIVLKHKRLNTLVMAGSLDDLARMIHLGRQWFILHPDAASVVPVANEEELLIHHQTTIADLRCFITLLTIEYQLLSLSFQPKITVDYGQTYGGWGDCGHGRQTQYYQAGSGRELLQKVIPAVVSMFNDPLP